MTPRSPLGGLARRRTSTASPRSRRPTAARLPVRAAGRDDPTTRDGARAQRARVRGDERLPVQVGPPDGRAAAPRPTLEDLSRDEAERGDGAGRRTPTSRRSARVHARRHQRRRQHRPRRGRRRPRPRPRARAAALERRHQLHDHGRRGPGAPREPARRATTSCERPGPAEVVGPALPCGDGRRRSSGDRRACDRDAEYRRATCCPTTSTSPRYVGPYLFPRRRRRRIPATMYLVLAVLCCSAGWLLGDNGGLLAAAIVLALVAAYHFASALAARDRPDRSAADRDPHRRLPGRPRDRAARRGAGCGRGPVWRILLYSADEPPTIRGLVELDAVDGT